MSEKANRHTTSHISYRTKGGSINFILINLSDQITLPIHIQRDLL